MTALQEMLLQTDGKRILLAPAWPKDWGCDFKLHAPYQTTVEGRVIAGKIVDLKVTPKSRRKDVVICQSSGETSSARKPITESKAACANAAQPPSHNLSKAASTPN